MLTAYFDASGKPHDPHAMLVAGFVSTEKKWLRFEDEWAALLDRFAIPTPFHTTDYVAAKKAGYRQFQGRDDLRDEFEECAAKAIKKGTRKPIATGLLLADYRMVMGEYDIAPAQERQPFIFCAMNSVLRAAEWYGAHKEASGLEVVFETGDEDVGEFIRDYERAFGQKPLLRTKKQHPAQFAAADILAWRQARILKDHAANLGGRRDFFASIDRHVPQEECRFIHAPAMRKRLDQLGFKKRS